MQQSRIHAQTGRPSAWRCVGAGRGAKIARLVLLVIYFLGSLGVFLARPAFSASAILSSYDLPGNLNSESNTSAIAAPGFQQEGPSYIGITSNGLLAISVPATSAGPFTYQWYLNGSLIAGATTDSYQAPNTGTGGLGNYQLVARNASGSTTSAVVNVSFLDPDGSGLPEGWELYYFGQIGVDPTADPDGDGVDNYDEYLDGTNPTNAQSVMPRLYITPSTGGIALVNPVKAKYQYDENVQVTALPNSGENFIGWFGAITNTNLTINLVMNRSKTLNMQYGLPLGQVVNAPNLPWTTGGNAGWFGETNISFDGVSAAQSGVSLVGQQSWLQTVIASNSYNEVTFEWAASSEAGENLLSFALDGDVLANLSGGEGNIYWQPQIVILPPGSNVLTWQYAQNVADNDYGWINLDAGWLDQVQVTPLNLTAGGSTVVAWGDNEYGQTTVPPGLTNVLSISGGDYHSLALTRSGTVVAWGYNVDGETNVPAAANNVTAIAAGGYHNLALKNNGTVVAWGNDTSGQTDVPAELSNVAAIAAGGNHSLALQSNGIVVAWGDNSDGESTVPTGLSNVVAIAAGATFSVALNGDGYVIVWGDGSDGETNVPFGLSNVVAIAAGSYDVLALEGNDTVTAWGSSFYESPALTNVVQLASGAEFNLALEADGTITSWGDNNYNETNSPIAIYGFISVAAGGYHGLALLNDGAPYFAQPPLDQIVYSGVTTIFAAGAAGAPKLAYRWQFDGANIADQTNASLTIANAQVADSGSYEMTVSNGIGQVTSAATLKVVNSAPIITLQPQSVVVVPGLDVTFTTAAVGSVPISYQWILDGTNIPGATGSSLMIYDVDSDQAGTYQCVTTNLYGSAKSAAADLTFPVTVGGVSFSVMYSFGSEVNTNYYAADGANPYAGLVLGPGGYLYGTTSSGGTAEDGTVFRVATNGDLETLYSFGAIMDTNGDALDGSSPQAPLTVGADGNLYGTTFGGGANAATGAYELGTVFRVTTNGDLMTLYSFGSETNTYGYSLDGGNPAGALLQNSTGVFYGTTEGGGSNDEGTVFSMLTSGKLSPVVSFDYYPNGSDPSAGLVIGSGGLFYGTTENGGSNSYGTVFSMTSNGNLATLASFGGTNGASPAAPLVLGANGVFYGTTLDGGLHSDGTVFSMTSNGTVTVLYSFGSLQDTDGDALDGSQPGGLVEGRDGNFYGVTSTGGDDDQGTLFRISPEGSFSTVYRFLDYTNGENPYGTLVQTPDGAFWGTAEGGGANYFGDIFRVVIAQGPQAPVFQTLGLTNGVLSFGWSATPGQMYQVQTTTNLNGVWSNFGQAISAASTNLSDSGMLSNQQQFYRVVLVPE